MSNNNTLDDLFKKFVRGTITEQEKKELARLIELADNDIISQLLQDEWESTADILPVFNKEESADILKTILGQKMEQTPVVPLFKRQWFRIAAAAVLLIGAFAIYKIGVKNKTNEPDIVKTNNVKQDIEPGGNKAVLTLADGSQIVLDSAANGNLASQGNVKVIKLDGQLAYNTSGSTTEVLYNTISTPKGGQYQLVLADGTKVWLNAASSLRFPATFIGSERKVELTGEGYFEVAKSVTAGGVKQTFKVDVAGKGEVEVLGTHFNINSYSDEATINTTLVEGSVKVTGLTTHDSRLITPGQQAQLNVNGSISLNKNVDIQEIMAWKNGKFHFGEAADIQTIMRQIVRWYDVEVEYKGTVNEHIGGTISRNVNVSKVLEMLEMTGTVNFRVNGKKITVMPNKK